MIKLKNIIIATAVLVFLSSSFVFAADQFTNKKTFNVSLPHNNTNGTFASAIKTTSRAYGQVEVTSMGSNQGIHCWFRSKKADGSWDALTSKMLTFTGKGKKKAWYYNADSGYTIPYSKDTSAQLRGENIANTWLIKDTVKGNVWFN